jgi:hypothetical protein
MMRPLSFLFWHKHIEYPTIYPLPEAIARLKSLVCTGFMPRAGVNGKVSERNVRLYWVIPFVANSFAPVFVGKFESTDGKVILSGNYSMYFAVKLFMAFWLAVTLLASLIEIGVLATGYTMFRENSAFLLVPCGLFVFGLVLVQTGRWFSRNHIGYITEVIRNALERTT